MKKITRLRAILGMSVIINLLFWQSSSGQVKNSTNEAPLKLVSSILLPDVSGRIDHLAFNSRQRIIYVAALGNNTVEVVDLKNKKVVYTIKGLHEPQGIKYIAESNSIFVANGENGECDVFNADTYLQITSLNLNGDADNVRYDSITGNIYIGYGDGGIAIIDGKTYKQLADIKLPGHPESFQLDKESKRIFVNVPDVQMLVIIDIDKKSIAEMWKMEEATSNFPMAIDESNHRIFIGCRHPAELLVINTETGKTITSIDIDSDTDDVFYNNSSKQIYVSCGNGYVDVIKQIEPDKYEAISRIESRSGARTSLFVPELNQLIVAAPARTGNEAQLMVYEKK
jgi:YVTN family beta-propeller protein